LSDPLPSAGALVDDGGRVICARCTVAKSMWARSKGLLGRSGLPPGEGLLIPKTGSIHTFFMRFPMDAVYLGRDLRVRAIVPAIPPYRVSWRLGARSVLELGAGEAERAGIRVGTHLSWHDPK
jgi:hypothetical protein